MADPTHPDTTIDTRDNGSALLALVDSLEREKEECEARALAITMTLNDLRARLARVSGARSGKNARSGKRRRKEKARALPFASEPAQVAN